MTDWKKDWIKRREKNIIRLEDDLEHIGISTSGYTKGEAREWKEDIISEIKHEKKELELFKQKSKTQ